MKERWDLLPLGAVREVVRALTIGARKHREHGWRELDPEEARDRYLAALMRHVVAWRLGETADEETGLHPLAHSAADVLILLAIELGGNAPQRRSSG